MGSQDNTAAIAKDRIGRHEMGQLVCSTCPKAFCKLSNVKVAISYSVVNHCFSAFIKYSTYPVPLQCI